MPLRDSKKRAKVLESEVVYKGRVFELRHERVAEPDGVVTFARHRRSPGLGGRAAGFSRWDGFAGPAVSPRGRRATFGSWSPAAWTSRANPSAAAAKRELLEEAGYTARRWRKLLDYFPSPGLLSERMHIFLATDLTAGVAQPEDDERITARRFRWRGDRTHDSSGTISDGKSLAGLLYYLRFVAARKR